MKQTLTHRLQQVARNFAIVAGGAWATVEVVDFAIEKYGFDPRLLHIAVLILVTASVAVVVLTWYHGQPGRQVVTRRELAILGGLAIATVVAAAYVGTRDPLNEFHSTKGLRLAIEFRNRSPMEPKSGTNDFQAHLGEGVGNFDRFMLKDGSFYMNPVDFWLKIPGVNLDAERLPYWLHQPEDKEYSRLTIILPDMPEDVYKLLNSGPHHQNATIETSGLGIKIARPFEITESGDSVLIRILGSYVPQSIDDPNSTGQ